MEVSALRYSGGIGLHGRSPLLRLQSDERLITYIRRGSTAAFEVLVSRYQARLLAFCRHLLGSKEDAEDVLQEVLAAAFNAILADDRPINVRPWLYRIARNRSLNHMRRIHAVGVDSMDVHLSDNGASTADKVHDREDFRSLVGDIQDLPETQRTALVLREMDALSYEQIAEAMETTVPGVKSLLVRARVSLAEAAEARLLSCEEVRIELGEVAEGLRRRPGPLVRRHLRSCKRCSSFKVQLKETNKALAAVLPLGPLVLLKKLALTHLGHSAGAGSGATGAGAAGQAAAVGSTAAAGATVSSAGGVVSAGIGAVATKAAAGLAAAALVTAGAVEVTKIAPAPRKHLASLEQPVENSPAPPVQQAAPLRVIHHAPPAVKRAVAKMAPSDKPVADKAVVPAAPKPKPAVKPDPKAKTSAKSLAIKTKTTHAAPPPGRTQTQTDPTVLTTPMTTTTGPTPTMTTAAATGTPPATDTTTSSADPTTTPTSPTATTPTTTSPPPATQPAPDTGTPGTCADISATNPSCPPTPAPSPDPAPTVPPPSGGAAP
ncbi:MAG: sigma-70 family RNA polymerase sigma factor [Solirubrobacterales bacterium]|nr:sigma-70 family RNA polymerase sigma factor [Solirubrobacterales bacterium]